MNEQEVIQRMTLDQSQQAMIRKVLENQDEYSDVFCANCGGQFFDQGVKGKAISQFDPLNILGSPQVVTITIWICLGCGIEIFLVGSKCNVVEKVPAKGIVN